MKNQVHINDIIENFERTSLETNPDRKIPFKNSEMASAVKEASLKKDKSGLERLSTALTDSYVKMNPDKPKTLIEQNAHETFLCLAYLADHSPVSPLEYMELGSKRAYSDKQNYGRAMTLAKEIYQSKGLDIVELASTGPY